MCLPGNPKLYLNFLTFSFRNRGSVLRHLGATVSQTATVYNRSKNVADVCNYLAFSRHSAHCFWGTILWRIFRRLFVGFIVFPSWWRRAARIYEHFYAASCLLIHSDADFLRRKRWKSMVVRNALGLLHRIAPHVFLPHALWKYLCWRKRWFFIWFR